MTDEERKHIHKLIDEMIVYANMVAALEELEKKKLKEAYQAIKEAEHGA